MNIRFFNCRILTMEDGKDIIDGELQVQDGRITYIGKTDGDKISDICWDREIDCEKNLLMPGFKNARALLCRRSASAGMALRQGVSDGGKAYERGPGASGKAGNSGICFQRHHCEF